MEIFVNGEKMAIEEKTSLAALLSKLSLENQAVAVEINGQVIKKQNHATTQLHEADRLEMVTFVGGG